MNQKKADNMEILKSISQYQIDITDDI
jgi:hypothetical protein